MSISIFGKAEYVYNRGLHFCSFEVDQDKRTGLNLTPQKKLDLPNGFSIQFDIKLRRELNNFGYVYRIIGNDSVNIDLVSNISELNLFSLVSGIKTLVQIRKSDLKNFKADSWLQINFTYNPKNNQITLRINDLVKTAAFKSDKFKSVDVYFGGNRHALLFTTDVSPMTIRDIMVFNEKKEVIRNWKLEKHATDEVYDECANQKASCLNPVWEIDRHVKWQQKAHFVLPYIYPQIAFDNENERLFIVKGKSITIYNPNTEQIDSFVAKKGEAYNCMANQLVYDKNSHKLVSYSFDNTNPAMFDFQTKEWSNENNQIILPQFWHHSKYLDLKDSTLITIGGYGYHIYSGNVMQYSFKNKEWKQHDISSYIPPRYLGSLGSLGNNELLYFGGYGSKTGKQEQYPRNYYDLYKINSQTIEVKKMWGTNIQDEHFTNSNSLVVNKEKGVFYNLTYSNVKYSTSIKLMELSIEKPEYKILGDSIPYKFKDIESYCDLYYCAKTSQLLAITSVSKNNLSEINIYSIAYPPLQSKEVLQEEESISIWKWHYLLILIIIIPLYFIVRKRKFQLNNTVGNLTEAVSNFKYNVPEIELKPSSVNLLGCFQTVDIDGINITGSFTPTISQLFVLIILYTVKNGQGISSQELTDILWYDKDVDSARNNRNVNFSKLRLLLKKVGDLELINNNSYWSIQIGKDVFCDYKNVMYLIDLIKKQQQLNLDVVHEFVNIASRGVLLPNVQDEWLDSFKGDYTNLVIETLTNLSKNADISTNLVLLLRISDAILLHDNIDEDAAKLKVYALYNLGKKGQAKQYFDKFLEEYKSLMGNSFKESFDQFKEMKK
jgi:DNA-binding SARP family transcriptional activator